MKNQKTIEQLIKKYTKLGYKPLNIERDLEVSNIIKWIWTEYHIYVDVQYNSLRCKEIEYKYMTYSGFVEEYIENGRTNRFYYETIVYCPFEAKFLTLFQCYNLMKSYHCSKKSDLKLKSKELS